MKGEDGSRDIIYRREKTVRDCIYRREKRRRIEISSFKGEDG